MSRRSQKTTADQSFEILQDILMTVPMWVGPLLAGLAYLAVRFVAPAILNSKGVEPYLALADTSVKLAWLAPLPVILAWVFAEFKKYQRRQLLDAQTGASGLRDISWQEFEHLVGEAFRRQGYSVQESGGSTPDGGVDLILRKDGRTTFVQCKQWKTRLIGVKIIRELYGVMAAATADHGIVVGCGQFTRQARNFADGKPIDLIDGQTLWQLVQSVKKDNTTNTQPTRPTTAGGQQPQRSNQTTPTCPLCNAPMILRTARRGQNAGSQFYGCSKYPTCKGTRQPT